MTAADGLFHKLIGMMRSYHPSNDFTLLEDAYELAKKAHENQERRSGEPYIIHPLKVAIILAELELDMESIAACILHDIVEDTEYTTQDLTKMFSEEIALLVDGVTNLGKISYSSKEERQAENYRKMFLAMAKDIRVILIKLADRLHNMRTLNFMPEHKQKEKSQETIDIYAPLAHRLGISKLRIELEDLSFKYLYPDAYHDLADKISKKLSERVDYVNLIVREIQDQMEISDVEGLVEGRPKHFFSIYKKMISQNKTLDQIYDLFAIRAIVGNKKDCYAVLGLVHVMYKPLPGRFKDYIAMPKSNMYQSIHNTLIGPGGDPFEIQIRTREMHRTAEYGIAAHWKYKESPGGQTTTDSEEAKLTWLRQILEWQRDLSDNREFMDAIKLDLNVYNDQVYVFTPKGAVINLPKGSTPIDFAYSIHSAIGNKMVGARVNGKMVNFDYGIRNGDRIEVITSQNSRGPSLDWLNIVQSTQAKNKIKQWFKKQSKVENIQKGKELIEKDARKKGFAPSDLMKSEWIEIVINKYGFNEWDTLCAAVGHGGVKEGQVVNRLVEEYQKVNKKHVSTDEAIEDIIKEAAPQKQNNYHKGKSSGIIIKGVDDPLVRLSKCCNPVPGDEIVGYVTRGRGVSIHRTDCINILKLDEIERHRLLESEWDTHIKEKDASFSAEIRVICTDRLGLLVEILKTFADEKMSVKSMNAKTYKNKEAVFNFVIDISGKKQLEKICNKIKSIQNVHEIDRVMS